MEFIKNIGKTLLVKGAVMGLSLFYTSIMMIIVLVKWVVKGKSYWYVKERTLPPLVLQDPALGRHAYINLKDVKIHYVENGDRSKPLMLFVHGFPEFWFGWRKQLLYFSRTHWVVALDLRGYGDSDKPKKKSAYKMDLLTKDIYDFVKALQKDECILVGHDWGGVISWNVAANYPEIVEKLVILNAPHPNAFRKKLEGSIKQFLKSWYIFAFQLPYFPEMYLRTDDLEIFRDMFENKISEEDLEAYKYIWARPGALTPPINYYRESLAPQGLLNPVVLPKFAKPTLIIWGENDLALDKDLAEMSKPYAENVKIHYIQGSHFIQTDRPDEVNQALGDFVGVVKK